jgi:hypothetical protein
MKITVDPDEPVRRLPVVGESLFGTSRHPEHGGQVQLRRAEEIMRRAGFLASAMRLAGQFLGASQVTDGPAVVNEVGGRRERVHVIVTQVVAVALEHMLPLLHRVPVIPGLTQCGGELFRRREPLSVLPAADRLERVRDVARYVQRFLVLAEAPQVTSHRVLREQGVRVVGAQDLAAAVVGALVDLQGLGEIAE